MKWFRMYWSLVDSVKVGTADDGAFRTYIQLQCLAGQLRDAGRTGAGPDSINWRLRRDALVTMQPLLDRSLVAIVDGEYVIPDWEKMQLKDDSSERVREFRHRKSLKAKDGNDHVTPQPLQGNAGEERRVEEKRKPSTSSAAFAAFWSAFPVGPRKVGKDACSKKWVARKLDDLADTIIPHVRAMATTDQWRDFCPAPLTYLNQSRWNDGLPAASVAPGSKKVAL